MTTRDEQRAQRGVLVVLTLEKHMDGIWITKLFERLKESIPNSTSFQNIEIEIQALENWLAEGWLVSDKTENDSTNTLRYPYCLMALGYLGTWYEYIKDRALWPNDRLKDRSVKVNV